MTCAPPPGSRSTKRSNMPRNVRRQTIGTNKAKQDLFRNEVFVSAVRHPQCCSYPPPSAVVTPGWCAALPTYRWPVSVVHERWSIHNHHCSQQFRSLGSHLRPASVARYSTDDIFRVPMTLPVTQHRIMLRCLVLQHQHPIPTCKESLLAPWRCPVKRISNLCN